MGFRAGRLASRELQVSALEVNKAWATNLAVTIQVRTNVFQISDMLHSRRADIDFFILICPSKITLRVLLI